MKDQVHKSESESRLFERILKYTGVFGGVQGVAMIVTLVVTKVKSVLLGPAGYGMTENLNRTADIIKNATNLGIQTVAVPKVSEHSEDSDDTLLRDNILITRSWALLTAVIGMAVCLVLAPVLGRWAFAGDEGYTVSFMFMSLAVAAAAVTGGEMAVLRGTKLLRQIALSQLLASILSLCISVPLYWFLRLDGVVPALVLSAAGTMCVTCFYSFRAYPFKACPFSMGVLRKGFGMIGFGVFFTITAFVSAWAWSIIARFLTNNGGTELTGTYSAGYMLVTYFATLLLSVTDSEYYPRLSTVCHDKELTRKAVDSQAQAMLMLAAPLVICFIIAMPFVVYIVLEYEKFGKSIALARLAVMGVFFKSVSIPIAYLPLSKSDPIVYVIQETLCYIFLILCVILGYDMWGIIGVGLSLAVWEAIYLLIVLSVSRIRYGYVMSGKIVMQFLIQCAFVVIVSILSLCGGTIPVVVSILLLLASFAYTLYFFSRHTTFLSGLGKRIKGRFSR